MWYHLYYIVFVKTVQTYFQGILKFYKIPDFQNSGRKVLYLLLSASIPPL